MTKQDNGGPAFPASGEVICDNGHYELKQEGMSLLDWFAGMALQGDMASQSTDICEWGNNTRDEFLQERAKFLYRFADAMLTERNKRFNRKEED